MSWLRRRENLSVDDVSGVHGLWILRIELALDSLRFDDESSDPAPRAGWVAAAGEGDVQLAVAEHRTRKEEADAAQRLALALVDGHGKRNADRELPAAEREGEARVRGLQRDARHHDAHRDEVPRDDDALEHVVVDAGEHEPRAVAEAILGVCAGASARSRP